MGCNSSTPNSEPTASGSGAKGAGGSMKGRNTLPMVEFDYYEGFGRGEPLAQMFTYHGQKFKKNDQSFPGWDERKANGDGGEFGGGLPQALFQDKGKKYRAAQFGAILRSFGIRFGYYNPRDWKSCRYIDPVVDTFADVLAAQSVFAFAQDDEGRNAGIEKYKTVATKFYKLVESNMKHHGGKYAAGNMITIADFVIAGHMTGCSINKQSPLPFYGLSEQIMPSVPTYKALQDTLMKDLPFLQEQRPPYPF